jgi:hypothetical protein
VDLTSLGLGLTLDGRVLLLDPLLDRLGALLVGAFDRLCGVKPQRRRYSPAARMDNFTPYSRSMNWTYPDRTGADGLGFQIAV